VATDQKGEITDFPWGPSDVDLPYVLFVAIRTLFSGLIYTTGLFKVDRTKHLQNIDQTLKTLAGLLNRDNVKRASP
jgi:hypothetical protein